MVLSQKNKHLMNIYLYFGSMTKRKKKMTKKQTGKNGEAKAYKMTNAK